MASKMKGEKKQHIQVFTRVRPLNSQEFRSQVVVECLSSREVCVRDKSQTKTFTFDRVFGPDSKQVDIYKVVVSPLISEVLQGYNCTVFAYGQTGTGKTFTMVGERTQSNGTNWEDDPNSGIIPRTLSHLFDELKVRAEEFTVRVSFLELYNEELYDLLAPSVNDDNKNLRLYEDSMKKGSVIVSGLEERTVNNKDDVYAILEAGNIRRQTAPTLMNAQSSRSHTIFTITVHIKVTTPEGEDLIKTGKLNLVDLAGSENIGRSGAVDMRAREAGNINQSLLTLGRVITSLVERTPHVPYRESKLTRILQDSLGGRTKTSIIATVSPACCNTDETLCTFDYVHRARNITNKPEINQKTSKRVLLREYTEEIERLRRDLIATREKHGVYLASDNYNALIAERENLNKELISKLNLLKVREEELAKQEEILKNLNMNLFATQNELENTCKQLQETQQICLEKDDMLNELSRQTDELLRAADAAVADTRGLHDRLDRSRRIQEYNSNSTENFKKIYCTNLSDMKAKTREFLTNGVNEVQSQIEMDKEFLEAFFRNHNALKEKMTVLKKETEKSFQTTLDEFSDQMTSTQKYLNEQLDRLTLSVDVQNSVAQKILSNLLEYSRGMNSNWDNLLKIIEKNKEMFEKQRNELQLLQEQSAELTKIISELPIMLSNRIKEQDEIISRYEGKLQLLEEDGDNISQRNEEFGRQLLRQAQDFVDRLEADKTLKKELKKLNAEKKQEESNMKINTLKSMQKTILAAGSNTREAENKISNALSSAVDVIENYNTAVLPLIREMSASESVCVSNLSMKVNEGLEERQKNLMALAECSDNEKRRIREHSDYVGIKSIQNLEALRNINEEISNITEAQVSDVEKLISENLRRKHSLCLNITGHSEEIFSNIHNRMKEIAVFFTEGIQRDEKTGETPQRREFNYPRRIVNLAVRNRIEPNTEPRYQASKKLEKHLDLDSSGEFNENTSNIKKMSEDDSFESFSSKSTTDAEEELSAA